MRPIKFRAWDNHQKKMYCNINTINFSTDVAYENFMWPINEYEARIDFSEKENSLMQFTGLLDKNGKEIYEGDILKTPHKNSPFYVVYEGYGFELKNDVYGFAGLGMIWDKGSMEVIGNIYENPELLTQ